MSSDLPHDSKTVDSLVKSVQQELNQDEKSLFYSLGVSFVYWNAPEGVLYSAPYERIGREVWIALRHEMYKILCDETELVPTEWVSELISGDIRNVIVGIITAITAHFDIGAGIVVPAVALVLKTGVNKFCSEKPVNPPARTLQQILEEKQKLGEKTKK